jgi:hypothetical protein
MIEHMETNRDSIRRAEGERGSESRRWHPAKGRGSALAARRPAATEAEVVDFATARALRLLARAGMIERSAMARGRTVR